MKKSVHYTIDRNKISENKADARRALKDGAVVTKVVRIEYQTGPTTVIVATITDITKPKDV